MSITESERFDMQVELRKVLGEAVAKTLIDHLPPSGWADVARKSDLEWLRTYVDLKFNQIDNRFDQIESRFNQIDNRFDQIDDRINRIDKRIDGLVVSMWAMTGVFTTAFIGLFTMLFTRL